MNELAEYAIAAAVVLVLLYWLSHSDFGVWAYYLTRTNFGGGAQ